MIRVRQVGNLAVKLAAADDKTNQTMSQQLAEDRPSLMRVERRTAVVVLIVVVVFSLMLAGMYALMRS